jgi:hypothetical protein
MSTPETPVVEQEIDATFPVQESNDGGTELIHDGKPQKRSSFADALKGAKPAAKNEEKEVKEDPAPKEEAKIADPIADKIAAEKKEPVAEEKMGSLLDAALKKKDADKAEKKEKAAAKEEEPSAVTDADIEEELKNPHRSPKTQNRIKALHKQWKDADAKVATTTKALAEKDAKLAEIEKKLSEAGKAAGVAPEIQAQLDELQQYRRQYEVENSPRYKEFNEAHEATETKILSTLKNAGVKFKGQTWEQTEAYIKEVGGYAAFQKKHPDLARNIREDVLEVADSDEISAAISRQKLLEETKKAWVGDEKKQAKEYFAKMEAERKAAAESAPKPEAEKQARKAKLEQWREQTFNEVELFKDEAVPSEASDDVRASVKKNNELKAFLRKNLESNLNLDKEEDIARVALDATLAHFFKKTSDGLSAENEQLRAEIKKLKTAGKTITKGTQAAAPLANEKPPKSFEEALDRVAANKQ